MEPINGITHPEPSWLMIKNGVQKPLRKIVGVSELESREGINTRGANGILFLSLLSNQDDIPYVQNMNDEGAEEVDQKE